jgi:hypothetical protein
MARNRALRGHRQGDPDLSPGQINVSVDGFTTVAGTATNTCNGDIENISNQLEYWSAVNPVIAQVTTGKVTGLSPGLTAVNASGTVAICYGDTLHWENLNVSDPITVQMPTSATILSNTKQTYSNQTWTSCDGSQSAQHQYGYERCVTYQVMDQESPAKPIQQTLGISESIAIVDRNYNATTSSGNSTTNVAGQFLDMLALLGTSSSSIQPNACAWIKQTFTATGNSSPIRVNCINFSATDATITDVTSNPGQCVIALYSCH